MSVRAAGATTTDLDARVAQALGITKTKAQETVREVIKAMCDLTKETGRLQIAKFGTICVRTTAARDGRNPKTGATMKLPATKALGFKAAKSFKDDIRK